MCQAEAAALAPRVAELGALRLVSLTAPSETS